MNGFIFPGQPLYRSASLPRDDDWREIVSLCRQYAGFDPDAWCRTGADLSEQVTFQIYGVAMSLYGNRLLARGGVRPAIVAEHSMGIYPALACCGCLSEESVLELTVRAGCAMIMSDTGRRYALGCVVGLTVEPLLAIAENHGVYIANHNTDRHFLLSGTQNSIEDAMAEAVTAGAFSVRTFPCDAPLHTPLMAERESKLREIFADYHYREPTAPLMNHIDQEFLTGSELGEFMMRELFLPVHWDLTYRALRAAGVSHVLEVGGGDSLKKYNRWIDSQASVKPGRS
jgi:malonyl CoA-acyl carrier protein transacylase